MKPNNKTAQPNIQNSSCVIFGKGELSAKILRKISRNKSISIKAVLPNSLPDDEFESAAKSLSIPIVSKTEAQQISCSFILILHHDWLIKPESYQTKKIFNIHSGHLPERRGHGSNILSFLNFQPISLSLHTVNTAMDDGEVLTTIDCPYTTTDSYQTIQKSMQHLLLNNIDYIINLCINYIPNPQHQTLRLSEIKYSSKFNWRDGIIDFNLPGPALTRLAQVFLAGTGLFITHKQNHIQIQHFKFVPISTQEDKIRIIGTVVDKYSNETTRTTFHIISCKGGYIEVQLERELAIGTRLQGAKLEYIHS